MSEKIRDFYRELRCIHCQKLICFEYIFDGYVKFLCPRCGETSEFHFKHRRGAKNDIVSSDTKEINNNGV